MQEEEANEGNNETSVWKDNKKILIFIGVIIILIVGVLFYRSYSSVGIPSKILQFSLTPSIPVGGQIANAQLKISNENGVKGFEVFSGNIKKQADCKNQEICFIDYNFTVPLVKTKTYNLTFTILDSKNKKTILTKSVFVMHNVPIAEAVCGNGFCETGENASSCMEDCYSAPVCGDGICELGENSTSCTVDCSFNNTPAIPICGNGIKETGEECDDANTNDTDDCFNNCTINSVQVIPPLNLECTVDSNCSDNNVCTDNFCNLTSHNCSITFNVNSCDDSNASTVNDSCALGVCSGIVVEENHYLPGSSNFGVMFNTGFKPTDFNYTIAYRNFFSGWQFEDPNWMKTTLISLDTKSNSDMYTTIVSEFTHNRWIGVDTDPQKSYCIPQGKDRDRIKKIYSLLVERYDGDSDYGCSINNNVDCYNTGDGLYPNATAREHIRLNPMNNWQVENEIFDQYIQCGYNSATDTYTFPSAPLDSSKRPSKETILAYFKEISNTIKAANPKANVILPSFSWTREILFYNKLIPYYESTGIDCTYFKVNYDQAMIAGTPESRARTIANINYAKGVIEYLLTNGKDYYDMIDYHDYSNDPYANKEVMSWFRSILGPTLDTKRVISTENGGPWNFFPFMQGATIPTCDATKDCVANRCSSQPYSEAVLSDHVVKRFVSGLSSGMGTIFWSTLIEWTGLIPFQDNFARLGLVINLNGKWDDTATYQEKPAYFTYLLMVDKLYEFTSAQEIQNNSVYKFGFRNKNPVYVAWNDEGDKTIDLSDQFSSPNVKITHIITKLDANKKPIYPADEIISANNIKISVEPIFIEQA